MCSLTLASVSVLKVIFPRRPGLASIRISPFWILLELRVIEVAMTTGVIRRAKCQSNRHPNKPTPSFLQAGCPSCRPTNSVRTLKGNDRQVAVNCYSQYLHRWTRGIPLRVLGSWACHFHILSTNVISTVVLCCRKLIYIYIMLLHCRTKYV